MKEFKGYKHGVNLGGWLSQCRHMTEHYENFIKEEDIEKIKSWGLDHVRIPIDYELVEDADGNEKADGYVYIDRAIEWCKKYGLNMILDLHKTYGYSFHEGYNESGLFGNESYQERFYKLWERLAARYGKYESMLSFELLNEVTDKSYCDKWNEMTYICIERIRKIAPTIKILVGGYWNNSVESVADLLPPYDENIVYNFHCYEPLVFTHQKAGWVKELPKDKSVSLDITFREIEELTDTYFANEDSKFTDNCDDPDAKFDSTFFNNFFKDAIEYADEHDTALYCGEYGVIDVTDNKDILKWYQMIHETFEKYNIGRAAWSYKWMNFGLSDDYLEDVREEVIKNL